MQIRINIVLFLVFSSSLAAAVGSFNCKSITLKNRHLGIYVDYIGGKTSTADMLKVGEAKTYKKSFSYRDNSFRPYEKVFALINTESNNLTDYVSKNATVLRKTEKIKELTAFIELIKLQYRYMVIGYSKKFKSCEIHMSNYKKADEFGEEDILEFKASPFRLKTTGFSKPLILEAL